MNNPTSPRTTAKSDAIVLAALLCLAAMSPRIAQANNEGPPIDEECPYPQAREHGAPPAMPEWQIGTYDLHEKPIQHAFYEAADPWGGFLNLGILWPLGTNFPTEAAVKQISVSLTSATVGAVFDAVTAADGSYAWKQEGIVFNVLPKPSTKTRLIADVLERRLPRFDVVDVDYSEAEVELILAARKHGITSIRGFSPIPPEERKGLTRLARRVKYERFTLRLNNPTLRECLNAIVSADPPSQWWAYWTSQGIRLNVFGNHPVYREDYPHVPPLGPFGRELQMLQRDLQQREQTYREVKNGAHLNSQEERDLYLSIKLKGIQDDRARYRELLDRNERCLRKRGLK